MDPRVCARSVNVVSVFNEFDYNGRAYLREYACVRVDTRVSASSVNGPLLGRLLITKHQLLESLPFAVFCVFTLLFVVVQQNT